MASLILRNQKGSPLTNTEVDGNFTALNTEITTATTNITTIQSSITNLRAPLQIVTGNINASVGNTYYVTSNATITLPSTPSVDDSIVFVAKTTFTINPRSVKINDTVGSLVVDNPPITFSLQYNATLGWIVI